MLTEIRTRFEHYFEDEQGRKQGEYKQWFGNRQLEIHAFYVDNNKHGEYKDYFSSGKCWIHCFYNNGQLHGEFKRLYGCGQTAEHCFYVKGKRVLFSKLPYPETDKDLMYFKLKYDLPLLSMETKC